MSDLPTLKTMPTVAIDMPRLYYDPYIGVEKRFDLDSYLH